MNPDKVYTKGPWAKESERKNQKLYEHEHDRVMKMTDKDLYTRYGKMTKMDKIDAFYKVLKKEKRCPTLQKKIKRHWAVSSGTIILYKLYNEKLAKEVYYKVDNSQTCLQVEIISYHNGDTDDKQLFDIADARKDWDIKCNSGFVPVEVEDHLKSINE